MFTDADLRQIEERGSSLAAIEKQIENFKHGFPFLRVVKAATIGDGIIRLSENGIAPYIAKYEEELSRKKVVKFVPASGAASRMFKALFAFAAAYEGKNGVLEALMDENNAALRSFFNRIRDFAFATDLDASFNGSSLESLIEENRHVEILNKLLKEDGLSYGSLPKGLLKFHSYGDGARTPVEEHLVEAANYGAAEGGTAYLHFTVSPEHLPKFEALVRQVKAVYEEKFNLHFDISYSIQKPSTDTIAVDLENNPFREEDGRILFRPGGHGALIENLNEIDADIIFIKNVDNVVPDLIKTQTYFYKKALAGVILNYQKRIFTYLERIENGEEKILKEIESFLQNELCVRPPKGYEDWGVEEKKNYFVQKLNRPIRVCGMVKNEGEPGGGPFWAWNPDGSVSLQIAESAQIDKNDQAQLSQMQHATHFNPVDLVCATRDRHGKAFDLNQFTDPQTGFISSKSKYGRDLKAQELPGLWNGAMSNWITLFVEVPIITFNPVKTVNDLLREQHQG
ncbi:MAG: DUF4301 family protein [Bacteroidota bacterium]